MALLALCLWSRYGQAQYSPDGLLMYASTAIPATVPADSTFHSFNGVSGTVPANAYPTLSMSYRAIVYATAGSSATTCTVALSGNAAAMSPPVTIPGGSTVSIMVEGSLPAFAGQTISEVISITAGPGGSVTVQPGTTLTAEVIPTKTVLLMRTFRSQPH